MDDKTKAIVAHITLIGWIISLIINSSDKTELASFYIRQMLGLILIGIVFAFIPIVGLIVGIANLVFWVISLIGAINGEKKLVPIVGQYFQDWFKGL